MRAQDARKCNRLYVYRRGELAASLTRTERGSRFDYDVSYLERARGGELPPVAFSLPLTSEPLHTSGDNLPAFFAGLLPEGRRLSAFISLVKTSADDMFSLLVASGTDCIGDVFVTPERGQSEAISKEQSIEFDKASFSELFEESLGSLEQTERFQDLSIPGVQPKISAEMLSFPLSLKKRKKRYILKLAPEKYPKLIENEHFFMQMARECGIESAGTQIVCDKHGVKGLLVERFDRRWDQDAEYFVRAHQEDACQFLGLYPQDKYRLSLHQISEGLATHASSPIVETAYLIRMTAFSYLIANGDMHAKNVSLLQESDSGRVILSPGYDLLSTLPYGDQEMALELEGRRKKILSGHFFAWGARCGVREAAVRSILGDLCHSVKPFIDRLSEIGLGTKKTDFLRRTMKKRLFELEDAT